MRAGTTMPEHSSVSISSGGYGLAGQALTRPRMPRMLVGRSSAMASGKWSRKPGPITVPNAAGPSVTAPPARLIAAIRSWPCART